MIYPSNYEDKTGFSLIRQQLRASCLGSYGQQLVDEMHFSTDFEIISKWLNQTDQFKTILQMGLSFPAQDFFDLTPELIRLRTPGTYIDQESLFDLKSSLETLNACLDFFKKPVASKFPDLVELASQIRFDPGILSKIASIMDRKGQIRDNASVKLKEIRKDIVDKIAISERRVGQLMVSARMAGWTTSDAEVTLRNGRLVIPIIATHKRKLKGLIHDESATGQTVFIEPEEVFELNNEIRELENAETREIIKILTAFSDFLRPSIPDLLEGYRFLGTMDFIRAKANFAIHINACKPKFSVEQKISWNNAIHPLLFLAHKAKRKKVVPLDITIDSENRILVISGPNAGGKSVCLKTIGLLQYMLQSGLLLPLQADSEAGIFKKIFIEIGDEQSLETDLSTYSSHLLHLKYFMEHCDKFSLFLVDEFGSGSDPSLGGAIAESVLEKLNSLKAFGVVTTHYSNLKLLAGKQPGILNGAMLFDTAKMQPLYRLVTGKPGSSFTFEIAEKIGFPSEVLKNATQKTDTTHLDFDRQLQELELEKINLEKQRQEFEVADNFINELIEKYEKLATELESSKSMILRQAREQARELLEDSNRIIEQTVKEIKESQAAKEQTKKLRYKLTEYREKLTKPLPAEETSPDEIAKSSESNKIKLKQGDWVRLEEQGKTGYLYRLRGDEAMVDFDGIRFTVSTEKLTKSEPPPRNTQISNKSNISSVIADLNQKSANFKLTIDVRGKRAEEALSLVQKYIDDAILLRVNEVNILHGKGDGILRKVIRELLGNIHEVESFSDDAIERGGSGITKVYLK